MVKKPGRRNIFFALLVLIILTSACTPDNATPSGNSLEGQKTTLLVINHPDFTAKFETNGGVLLSWEAVSGADEYQIELQTGGDEYIHLASVPSDQTTFLDKSVPSDTSFVYQLKSISKSNVLGTKQVQIETPALNINPLKITISFDQNPAEIDPANFDPSNIDPNNFDPSIFMPKPMVTEAVVGPKGGELTVKGNNDVAYTLNIPAGSLDFETLIKLHPISNIPDLPLSKGLIGSVFIEPETVVFRIPATLVISPQTNPDSPSGVKEVGFAFESDGQEFHLFPMQTNTMAYQGIKVARLTNNYFNDEPPKDKLIVPYGGGYGKGLGTPEDINAINNRNPSNSSDQVAQENAVAQLADEELAPLPDLPKTVPSLAKVGEKIFQNSAKADNWNKFMDTLDELTTYMNSEGGKYNKNLNEKIISSLLEKANKLLKKNMVDCISEDDLKAQELLERLVNPKDDFSKSLSSQFKAKYGQKIVDDLYNGMKSCTYQVKMKSNMSFDAEGSVLFSSMESQIIPLNFVYVKGEVFLYGSGPIKLNSTVSGNCSFPIQHYDNLTLSIQKLSPVFDKGKLIDFAVKQLNIIGWIPGAVGVSANADGCPTMVKLNGGGDYWTGMFTVARVSLKDEMMTGWKIQKGDFAKGGSLKANWQSIVPAFSPMGVSGKMSEDTKLELIISPGKK